MSHTVRELLAWLGVGILVTLGIMAIASTFKYKTVSTAEAARLAQLGLRQIKKLIILVVGVTVIIVGLIMLPGPGPGMVVIPIGLAVLATEFVWARRLLKSYKTYALNFKEQAEANEVTRPRPVLALFILASTVAIVLAAIFYRDWPAHKVLAVAGPVFGLEGIWCLLMITRYRKHKLALRNGPPLLPPPTSPDNAQAQSKSPDAPH